MNRIVRHHVPVSELPESLREGLDPGALATVEVTVETSEGAAEAEAPMTLEEILAFEQENAGRGRRVRSIASRRVGRT